MLLFGFPHGISLVKVPDVCCDLASMRHIKHSSRGTTGCCERQQAERQGLYTEMDSNQHLERPAC
jgi:hypothetical protein